MSIDLLVVAQPKALRLGLIEARHVTNGAGFDEALDQSRAERAGAAGDHDVTIAKVHDASSPIRGSEARPR